MTQNRFLLTTTISQVYSVLKKVFSMDNIYVTLNHNNEGSRINSNSPQHEIGNTPQSIGWKEQIKIFCNQEHQK